MMHDNNKGVFKYDLKEKKKIMLSLPNPQFSCIRAVYSI